MAYGDIITWGGELVTATLFVPTLQPNLSVSELFEVAYAAKPTQMNENVQPHGRVGSAALHDHEYGRAIVIQPGRVDFNIQGSERNFSPSNPPPVFTDVLNALEVACSAAKRIAPRVSTGGFSRVAVHCRMSEFFKTVNDANSQISKVSPAKLVLEDYADFIFQINSQAKVQGHGINRLVKWSVDNVQLLAAAPTFSGMNQTLSQHFSATVHMDFNTVPTHLSYGPEQIPNILDVLSGEVVRVRRNNLRFK